MFDRVKNKSYACPDCETAETVRWDRSYELWTCYEEECSWSSGYHPSVFEMREDIQSMTEYETREQIDRCINQYEQLNESLPDADSETESDRQYQCHECHGKVTESPTSAPPDSKWECEECSWRSYTEPAYLPQYESGADDSTDQRYQCPKCENTVIRVYQTDHDWECIECAYGSRGEPDHLATVSPLMENEPPAPAELTGELDGETDEYDRTGVESLHDERRGNDPTMDDDNQERQEHIEEALYDAENHIERALYACEDKELRGQLMGVRRSLVVMMTRHFDNVGENDE